MKRKRRQIRRKFCGILFLRASESEWRSVDGILLQRNHIGVKFEKWSVEEHPRGAQYRGTGATIWEALNNSGLLPKGYTSRLAKL